MCADWCQDIKNLSVSVLMAIFPSEPGLAGFIEAEDDGSGGDNWSYKTCKAPVKSSTPTNQHPTFYGPDAIPVAQPPTVSKYWMYRHQKPLVRKMEGQLANPAPPGKMPVKMMCVCEYSYIVLVKFRGTVHCYTMCHCLCSSLNQRLVVLRRTWSQLNVKSLVFSPSLLWELSRYACSVAF